MISVIQIIYRNNTRRFRRPPAPPETWSGWIVMFHRGLSVSAFPVSPNLNHALNSTPPFFSPGIAIKGALTLRFSDLTLIGG